MDMLKEKVSPVKTKQGSMSGFIIGLVIGVVILFALLPVVTAGISAAALTGTNATIANLVITLIILVPIAAIGSTLA